MATSGSRDFEPDVAEYIEEAFERCGLEFRTGSDGITARRSLNLLLADWANRGLNQWTIQNSTTTLTEGAESIDLTDSTIDDLDVVLISRTSLFFKYSYLFIPILIHLLLSHFGIL